MTELFRCTSASLQEAGWTCAPPLPAEGAVPSALQTAPDTVIRWVSSFSLLSNADETEWFLSRHDYSNVADDAFAWNECEQLSVQAAVTDDEVVAVSLFWKRHLPLLLSVRNGYEYLAVRDDGAVVHGSEPEFEETVVVFSQLEDLLTYISSRPAVRNHIVDGLLFDSPVSGTRR